MIGVDALRSGVAPSYVVPAASPALMLAAPAALIEISLWAGSNAKLWGAVISEPEVVQSEMSSSAMNASLKSVCTNSGYSSERKRKSSERQFGPTGTLRSTLRTVTSKSVLPRTFGPTSFAPLFGAEFGVSASVASPLVRIAYVDASVGKPPRLVVCTSCGSPFGGCETKLAPATIPGVCAIALARSSAVGLFVNSVSESFAGFASPTSPVTAAVLKITPPLLFVTVIVIVTLLPLLIVPRSQLTMRLASLQVPAVGIAETNVVLRWRVCVIDTDGALPGPAFETTVV